MDGEEWMGHGIVQKTLLVLRSLKIKRKRKDKKKGWKSKNMKQRYRKYADALAPHIDSIKRKIANSKDGTITMKAINMAKKLGMLNRHKTSVYAGIKYILFYEGIIVATVTVDGESMFVMRERNDKDRLPPYMR